MRSTTLYPRLVAVLAVAALSVAACGSEPVLRISGRAEPHGPATPTTAATQQDGTGDPDTVRTVEPTEPDADQEPARTAPRPDRGDRSATPRDPEEPTTLSPGDSGPRPDHGGDLIEIHRDRQVLLMVRDGQTPWAVHTSTGTGQRYTRPDGDVAVADTPAGTWEISWQVDGWRTSDLGRLWRPKYFHRDGLAVHGYPDVPAHPASHGCARVSIEAMNLIWERGLAPQGTTVVVH